MSTAADAEVRCLDPRYYTDAELYEFERERIMARTWQFAGHASRIKSPGDYFAFEIAGDSLFCVRDPEGAVRAFYNACQHRAHQLVKGDGNARRQLVCPYHGWSYDLSGALRAAPRNPNLDLNGICLTAAKAEVFCGFIFVNLDPDAKPMAEWFPGAEDGLREFVPDIESLEPLEWVEIPERCNWKVAVENHSECYHCARNHKAFASGVIKPQTYDIRPHGYTLVHTTECQNLERMSYPVDLESNPRAGDYRTWFLWPLFAFQVYPGNLLNTYHWRPHGVDSVTVWRGWYTVGGKESEVVRRLAVQDRGTTVEEDIHIVESVQRGLRSRGYNPGPLVLNPDFGVDSEHSVQALHQWTREALDGCTIQ